MAALRTHSYRIGAPLPATGDIFVTRMPFRVLGPLLVFAVAVGCQPTVKVEAPKEPITINLNIKLDADVRVRLEQQAQEDIQKNPDIF